MNRGPIYGGYHISDVKEVLMSGPEASESIDVENTTCSCFQSLGSHQISSFTKFFICKASHRFKSQGTLAASAMFRLQTGDVWPNLQ